MPRATGNLREFGLAFESTIKRHRWLIRLPHCRRIRKRWTEQVDHRPIKGVRRCLLDFRRIDVDGEQGRRFHALVRLLQRGGYELFMVPRLSFLQTGHRPFKARAIETIQPFFEASFGVDQGEFDLGLSDSSGKLTSAKQTIRVLTSKLRPLENGDLAMPYSFYPDIWDREEDLRLRDYRHQQRNWSLFFGGHCSQKAYSRIKKYGRMNTVNRYEVVTEVLRLFADKALRIDSDDRLKSAMRSQQEAFVCIDNLIYRTAAERWMSLLARSDFFLAAPGCDYPFSHNVIEAIAVGTIPVLEYGSLFTPALRDGVNCIGYQGREGLRTAISRIQQLSRAEIIEMRRAVIAYYENHLSPRAFCDQLESDSISRLHLFPYLTPSAASAA